MTHPDLGSLTNSVRENAASIAAVWVQLPWRRKEFGPREIADIREAVLNLNLLLSALDVTEAA